MRRRRLVVLVTVAALLAIMAAPVSARTGHVIRGDMDLTFVPQPCDDGRFLTWVGTVAIDDEVYGWADFPTAELVEKGGWMYFQEYWTIFTLNEGEDPTPAAACDPALVVIAGENKGIGTPWFTGFAWGKVTEIADGGPFEDVPIGSRMFWRGSLVEDRPLEPGDNFIAKLRIIARR